MNHQYLILKAGHTNHEGEAVIAIALTEENITRIERRLAHFADVPLHYVAPNPGGNLWGASLDASSVRLLARLARPGDEVHVSVYTAHADAPEGHALRTTSVELARPSQKERAIVGSWIADARIISLALASE